MHFSNLYNKKKKSNNLLKCMVEPLPIQNVVLLLFLLLHSKDPNGCLASSCGVQVRASPWLQYCLFFRWKLEELELPLLLRDDQVFLEYTPSTKMDSSKIERIEECYVLFVKSEGDLKKSEW